MDAFYASVEQRDNPALRGRPVIVGGAARRGVVLAASYEVRPFGVRSAMPMARAMRLAPDAVVVPPRHDAYADVSARVFDIMGSVTPLVEPLSLDEAFLDVTASQKLFGAPADVARRLRARIRDEIGLPASAGIAGVKLVAKIASDMAKPDGQLEVAPDGGAAFLAPLPVSRLWGVGPKSARALATMGLEIVGDIARRDPDELARRLGPSGRALWEQANAIDPRPVIPDRDARSIGAEETFDEDLAGAEALAPRVHAQALRVARRLRAAGLRARTVQLKLKRADFTLVTRRATLDEADRRRPGALPDGRGAAGPRARPADAADGRVGAEPGRGERAAARLVRAAPDHRAGAEPRARRDRRPLRRRQRHHRRRRRRRSVTARKACPHPALSRKRERVTFGARDLVPSPRGAAAWIEG